MFIEHPQHFLPQTLVHCKPFASIMQKESMDYTGRCTTPDQVKATSARSTPSCLYNLFWSCALVLSYMHKQYVSCVQSKGKSTRKQWQGMKEGGSCPKADLASLQLTCLSLAPLGELWFVLLSTSPDGDSRISRTSYNLCA